MPTTAEKHRAVLCRRLEKEIAYFQSRIEATADKRTTTTGRAAHTFARNRLSIARGKLLAVEAGRPMADWVLIRLN